MGPSDTPKEKAARTGFHRKTEGIDHVVMPLWELQQLNLEVAAFERSVVEYFSRLIPGGNGSGSSHFVYVGTLADNWQTCRVEQILDEGRLELVVLYQDPFNSGIGSSAVHYELPVP